MAPLTPRPSIRHDPITSSHLRLATFEKLDKDHLVNAYIRSQKLHAATYAADGKALVSSWDRRQTSGPVKHEDPRSHSHNYGFDTPVLKPRVAKQSDTVDVPQGIGYGKNGVVKNMQSKKPSRPVTKPEKELSSKTKKEKKRLKPAIGKSKSISKKRSIQADSDDDGHAARESCFLHRLRILVPTLYDVIFQGLLNAGSESAQNAQLCNQNSAKMTTKTGMVSPFLRIRIRPKNARKTNSLQPLL